MIIEVTQRLLRKENISREDISLVMQEILEGKTHTEEIIFFLIALEEKGETAEEITAAVEVMRRHVVRINSDKKDILDTCGTGGDKKGTFNISTAVAFVAAGCGITVAKHGNRSVSSKCGSADILEALGININMPKEKIEKCLNDIGIAFLFAQNLHPAMKHAMPARKQIGRKTIFNILGPLSNPAGASHQLIGVYDRKWTSILAEVLNNLGSTHALVVHGEDGIDEITTSARTFVSELKNKKIENYEITPEEFGINRCGPVDLSGGSAEYNANILLMVLRGAFGPYRDVVVLNAAAAIYAADKAGSIKEGIDLAGKSIDSGEALRKLNLLKEYSK